MRNKDLIENFDQFIVDLQEELICLKSAASFEGLKKMSGIISSLEMMNQKEIIPRLKNHIGIDNKEIGKQLERIFQPYFRSFSSDKELLEDLKTKSGNYFAQQKAYQLSHVRGIWKTRLNSDENLSPDVKAYFLGRLFIDNYETLPVVLRPVILYHWDKIENDERSFPRKTSKQYEFMTLHFSDSVFSQLSIDRDFNRIRNNLSHSKILFRENKIIYWDQNNSPGSNSPLSFYPFMETMTNLLVVFATDMDLRVLRMGREGNDEIFPLWMEYFENYVHWFVKNHNARSPNA